MYSTALDYWATRTLIREVLPLCRDAGSVLCSPSLLGHQGTHWGAFNPSAEMQSVYFTTLPQMTTVSILSKSGLERNGNKELQGASGGVMVSKLD